MQDLAEEVADEDATPSD